MNLHSFSNFPIPYSCAASEFHKYADPAGIDENVTLHMFRRSATTELIRNNANLYNVKEMLGHESLETLKHYTKLTITDLKRTHKKCHPRDKI
jgi:site-specific recombinase XerD